ncbi:heme/hemin ABC transporter substrate-binding protein [Gulosibacter bifidus]|uniref:Hemin ABC transporter substrate-binding protein n=1 Tax=Gulosibacter bifidus TaxID=272239 RepID=A0ABW5RIB9_9MICO|nr:ABC transporter substrate-binding protein [Gulosibacter bifidus]
MNWLTTSTRTLRSIAIIAALCTALATAGCATGGTEIVTATSPDASATSSAAVSDAYTVPDKVPDPRTLTGLTEAKAIPGVAPIDTDAAPQLPATVTGDDGVNVEVESIDRIVTLDIYGTTSQTLIGLGLEDNIAGRTVSDIDERIRDVPVVSGQGHSVDVEQVLAQNPTLVLADTTLGPASTIELLRNSGVDVVVLSPDRGADLIAEQITMIAQATGVPDAGKKLVERTEAELANVQDYVSKLQAASGQQPLRMAVLYVRGSGGVFFVFGKGSAATQLINDLGGDAVAETHGLPETAPANAESLISIDPETVIVMRDGLESGGGSEGLLARPGMAQTTAGANERIISVPDSQLISFGPNYPQALKAIADAVYLG